MTTYAFEVLVSLKPGLLDPAGKAVEGALPAMGWDNVANVRVGKHIALDVEAADEAAATAQVARDGGAAALEPGDRGRPGAGGGPEVTRGTPRVGVVTFPGSLDDRDALRAVETMGGEAVALWHADHDLHGVDAVILPGGFSYGDYLRAGALAARAPLMSEVAGVRRAVAARSSASATDSRSSARQGCFPAR